MTLENASPTVGGSNPTNEMILRSIRSMAWERAKGELKAVLHTYWNVDPKFVPLNAAIKNLIEEVEDNGWQE